jgi:uncharacterized protein (DUF488 family)
MEKHRRIVLLCAEKDENRCHRGYIKDKIREGVPPNPPEKCSSH